MERDETHISRKHLRPMRESGFMTLRQISEEFGMSMSFLYHLPKGTLREYLVGTKMLFERCEVIAAIKEGRLRYTPKPRRKRRGNRTANTGKMASPKMPKPGDRKRKDE